MAGAVIWHVTMSLDGFIAGPKDEIDWAFGFGKPGPVADEVIAQTGAIIAGRRGFDAGTRPGSGPRAIYGGVRSGPVFVLTHRAPSSSGDPAITFVSDGIESAVATARAAADGKSVGVFGASIGRQTIAAGLSTRSSSTLCQCCSVQASGFYDAPGIGQYAWSATCSSQPARSPTSGSES